MNTEIKPENDYRTSKGPGQGVALIVRPNNRYGSALPGERVLVDAAELRVNSTIAACMTDAEADELERKKAEEAARLAASRERKRSIPAMIERGLAEIQASARAKDKAVEEALESERLAAEADLKADLQAVEAAQSQAEPIPAAITEKKGAAKRKG